MATEENDASQSLVPVSAGSLALTGNIKDAVELAQLMAKAKVALPTHLHNNPGECLAIVMMAQTWGMNPYMVGQKTSVINSRLMYEGQLVNAVVNRSGFLNGRLTYELAGEGEALTVVVSGLLKGESVPRTITIGMPKAGEARNSPLWKSNPEQQLIYKAVRVWARRHIPEVLLGVYTPEDDYNELPREMVEVKEANAKAIEGRVRMLETHPIPALDPEIKEAVEKANAAGDVFTAGASKPATPPGSQAAGKPARTEPIVTGAEQDPDDAAVKRVAEKAADLFSQHKAAHSGNSTSVTLSDEAIARQDYIDAGHPVIEGILLCPETDYAALRHDVLKQIAAKLLAPAEIGLEPTPDAFEMIGGARLAKVMGDKGLEIIAGKVRQAFGVKA